MARRTGSADLPLHGGRVPPWLATRMATLGGIITQTVVHHYGRDEFLARLAHPFWFQSFGAVMGMDWHSSGITTSVIGALKRGLAPLAGELGIHVCGGRGNQSRRTPQELTTLGDRIGFDGAALTRTSRLIAKVDSAAVQDGFDLYLHGFFVTDDGHWTVVQQGMNGAKRQARRYHWHSGDLSNFIEEPHSAIDGPYQGEIINLTDRRADRSRQAQLDLLSTRGPDGIAREFAALSEKPSAQLDHAGAPRCPLSGCIHSPIAWNAGGRGRSGAGRFPRASSDAGRGCPYGSIPGHGRRGRAWHAVPLPGPGTLLIGAWR